MIREIALVAVAASGLGLSAVAPAAAQTGNPAEGRRCSFTSVTDPTLENGGVHTGQVNGGPLAATAPGATISMTCTIQVGAANSTHAGADSCSASSNPGLQVTLLPPTFCSYLVPEGQPVYMCTEVTINGQVYYWDNDPPGTGTWSTSNAAFCAEAISQEIFPGPLGPVLDLVDALLCPIFASLAPGVPGAIDVYPDGDVYIAGEWLWDCPPFDNPQDPPPPPPPPPPCIWLYHPGWWDIDTCDLRAGTR